MKTLAMTCCLIVAGLVSASATAKFQLDGAGFAKLCNTQGQDFANPFTLHGDLDVRGGTGMLDGCNVRVEPGAQLRFDHVTLNGCGSDFNIFGGDRSALDVDHSTIRMGDQNYFLFDVIADAKVRVSHSTLEQCGENEASDVVVTASTDGSGGEVKIDHSMLTAPTTAPPGAPDYFGHVVAFAPTGSVHLSHSSLSGVMFVIGTYAGGTCKADHNEPDVPCAVF